MLNKDNRKLKAAIKRMNAARSIVDYNAKVKMIRYVAVRNTDIKTVINALLESEKGKCNWILQYGGYHSLKYEGTCGGGVATREKGASICARMRIRWVQ